MDLSLSPMEQSALLEALDRSQGIIIFDPTGKILAANAKFMKMMGYGPEIIGQMHSMFVHPNDKRNGAYAHFWDRLQEGGFQSGEFRRLASGNRELWLSASYNALLDDDGKVTKIIKIARDITEQHRHTNDLQHQVQAINRSHAVIEFDVTGHITDANANFVHIAGYSLSEIIGKHHSIFLTREDAATEEYEKFWRDLKNGDHHQGEFKRIGKNGKPFWIRAAYNPIMDFDGNTIRVMKFALDITEDVEAAQRHRRAMYASESLFQEIIDQVGHIAVDINAITRQTKLLAINARIEAARIGEDGRSFAIVASDMAALSSHTAEATGQIAKLIQEGDQQSRRVISMFGAAHCSERSALALPGERG